MLAAQQAVIVFLRLPVAGKVSGHNKPTAARRCCPPSAASERLAVQACRRVLAQELTGLITRANRREETHTARLLHTIVTHILSAAQVVGLSAVAAGWVSGEDTAGTYGRGGGCQELLSGGSAAPP